MHGQALCNPDVSLRCGKFRCPWTVQAGQTDASCIANRGGQYLRSTARSGNGNCCKNLKTDLISRLRLNCRPAAGSGRSGACKQSATSAQAFAHCTQVNVVEPVAGVLAPHAKEVMEITQLEQ
jgi:hypothetical protein